MLDNDTFVPYFDLDLLKQKLYNNNTSIANQMKMGILREDLVSTRRFEVYA